MRGSLKEGDRGGGGEGVTYRGWSVGGGWGGGGI